MHEVITSYDEDIVCFIVYLVLALPTLSFSHPRNTRTWMEWNKDRHATLYDILIWIRCPETYWKVLRSISLLTVIIVSIWLGHLWREGLVRSTMKTRISRTLDCNEYSRQVSSFGKLVDILYIIFVILFSALLVTLHTLNSIYIESYNKPF